MFLCVINCLTSGFAPQQPKDTSSPPIENDQSTIVIACLAISMQDQPTHRHERLHLETLVPPLAEASREMNTSAHRVSSLGNARWWYIRAYQCMGPVGTRKDPCDCMWHTSTRSALSGPRELPQVVSSSAGPPLPQLGMVCEGESNSGITRTPRYLAYVMMLRMSDGEYVCWELYAPIALRGGVPNLSPTSKGPQHRSCLTLPEIREGR